MFDLAKMLKEQEIKRRIEEANRKALALAEKEEREEEERRRKMQMEEEERKKSEEASEEEVGVFGNLAKHLFRKRNENNVFPVLRGVQRGGRRVGGCFRRLQAND